MIGPLFNKRKIIQLRKEPAKNKFRRRQRWGAVKAKL